MNVPDIDYAEGSPSSRQQAESELILKHRSRFLNLPVRATDPRGSILKIVAVDGLGFELEDPEGERHRRPIRELTSYVRWSSITPEDLRPRNAIESEVAALDDLIVWWCASVGRMPGFVPGPILTGGATVIRGEEPPQYPHAIPVKPTTEDRLDFVTVREEQRAVRREADWQKFQDERGKRGLPSGPTAFADLRGFGVAQPGVDLDHPKATAWREDLALDLSVHAREEAKRTPENADITEIADPDPEIKSGSRSRRKAPPRRRAGGAA